MNLLSYVVAALVASAAVQILIFISIRMGYGVRATGPLAHWSYTLVVSPLIFALGLFLMTEFNSLVAGILVIAVLSGASAAFYIYWPSRAQR